MLLEEWGGEATLRTGLFVFHCVAGASDSGGDGEGNDGEVVVGGELVDRLQATLHEIRFARVQQHVTLQHPNSLRPIFEGLSRDAGTKCGCK